MDVITGSLPITEGVPYRLNELAELLGRARPTVDRYAAKYSFSRTTVTYKGKQCSAVVLTGENIRQLTVALQQDDDTVRTPVMTGTVATPLQQGDDQLQRDHDHKIELLETKLAAALDKVEELKARLDEQKTLYEKQIQYQSDHIATLKTSMVMMERLKRYSALDASPSKPGPLARLGQWLGGLGKPSKPAASYQQIDPVVEPVEEEAHAGSPA